MGKGIALQFKKMFPGNYASYKKACVSNEIVIGKMFVSVERLLLTGEEKIIINFPTKKHWRQPSQYSYISEGLKDLKNVIIERNIQSVTLPPLGCGNGGLEWSRVKCLIEEALKELSCEVIVYTPNAAVQTVLNKENSKLTTGRIMLLSVFYDLVAHEEFVTEFAGEKICYFLQRMGAGKYFNLVFEPYYYGPYSGKVGRVLRAMNGFYLTDYNLQNQKPFDAIQLKFDTRDELEKAYNEKLTKEEKEIVLKTKGLFKGFYSAFSMELLSSVDLIVNKSGETEIHRIQAKVSAWNERKAKIFNKERYIQIALDRLKKFDLA